MFKIPPQLIRLLLLGVAIVGSYLIARALLRPDSFGEYGHFRGVALEEIAARAPVYAGAKACDECHSDLGAKLAKAEHRTIACETCHGPNRPHVDNPDEKPPKHGDSLCLRCHEANPARPAFLKQMDPKDHFAGHCSECHLPHTPKEAPQ